MFDIDLAKAKAILANIVASARKVARLSVSSLPDSVKDSGIFDSISSENTEEIEKSQASLRGSLSNKGSEDRQSINDAMASLVDLSAVVSEPPLLTKALTVTPQQDSSEKSFLDFMVDEVLRGMSLDFTEAEKKRRDELNSQLQAQN